MQFLERVCREWTLTDDAIDLSKESAETLIDRIEIELFLGAESLVDGSVAQAEIGVEGPQRCSIESVHSEDFESCFEDLFVGVDLRATAAGINGDHDERRLADSYLLTSIKHCCDDVGGSRPAPEIGERMTNARTTRPTALFTDSNLWGDIDAWEEEALALHDLGPIHRIEAPGYQPFWAVIDHAAVLDVERRSSIFHNAPRPVLSNLEQDASRKRELRSLVHMDGEEHSSHRRLTADWFKPASVAHLQDRLDRLSANMVRHLYSLGGECDFVPEVALPYPLQVILEILGLPEGDYPLMLRLTQQLFGQEDPDLRRQEFAPEAREQIVADFFDYFRSLSNDRRANPTDDLATLIANGTIDGEPLPELSMLGYYIIVATAGHDTTSNAMASGMHLLASNPPQLKKVQERPDLLVNAIEEIIRRAAPVRHFMRTVGEDTEIAGQQVKTGDRVYLSYKAANLDPKVFDDPRRFDVERSNASKNVSFGYGVHFCLGSQLARNEMRSLFGHLIPRLRNLEPSAPAQMTKSTFVGGPKSVPIRYELTDL